MVYASGYVTKVTKSYPQNFQLALYENLVFIHTKDRLGIIYQDHCCGNIYRDCPCLPGLVTRYIWFNHSYYRSYCT